MADTLAYFRGKAPGIMSQLMSDLNLTVDDAGAIVGNLGHESMGFKALQEKKPLVPGSKGGYGWAQWTGPRRRAYEAYCARNNLDPASDKANYGYLYVELTQTDEKRAIPAVKRAVGLMAKVQAFELGFERAAAQYKHYENRLKYAQMAIAAYNASPYKDAKPIPTPPFTVPKADAPITQATKQTTGLTVATIYGMIMAWAGSHSTMLLIIGAVVFVIAVFVGLWFMYRRNMFPHFQYHRGIEPPTIEAGAIELQEEQPMQQEAQGGWSSGGAPALITSDHLKLPIDVDTLADAVARRMGGGLLMQPAGFFGAGATDEIELPPKPWYQSSGAWGNVVTMAVPMLALFAKVSIPPELAGVLPDIFAAVGTVVAALVALRGRAKARQPLALTKRSAQAQGYGGSGDN